MVLVEVTPQMSLSMSWLHLCLAYPCQAPTFHWLLALPAQHVTPIYLLHLVPLPPQLLAIHPWQSIQFLSHHIGSHQARTNTTVLLLERKLASSEMNGKDFSLNFDTWLANARSHRDNIELLVKKVSGSCYKSFPTHKQVLAHYSDAKRKRQVEVIRDPRDDEIYGPRMEAEQSITHIPMYRALSEHASSISRIYLVLDMTLISLSINIPPSVYLHWLVFQHPKMLLHIGLIQRLSFINFVIINNNLTQTPWDHSNMK